MKTTLILAGLALALTGCNEAATSGNAAATADAAPIAPPAGTQWTDTASKTPAGGFVQGNPNAPVKFVEYGALSCGACAAFAEQSGEELKQLIAKGTVSYEFRPFLLNALDVPAFLLARCSGPGPFFAISDQMFAAQPEWLGAAQTITPQEQQGWQGMPPERLAPQLAERLGLIGFVQQRGIGASQAQACLTDKAAIDELTRIGQTGTQEFDVTGTPTFVINGKVDKTIDTWDKVEVALAAAGA